MSEVEKAKMDELQHQLRVFRAFAQMVRYEIGDEKYFKLQDKAFEACEE